MRQMFKYYIGLAIMAAFCLMSLFSYAGGELVFTASVNKKQVAEQGTFQITFSVQNGDVKKFIAPSLADFHVISGPNSSSNFQFINGQVSKSQSWSYELQPKKVGQFTFQPAQAIVGDNTIQSNKVSIEVVKGNPTQQAGGNDLSDKVFLRLLVNKNQAYQGEQIIATYKIYTALNIVNYGIDRLPANTGFWTQEIEMADQQLSNEVINGVQYRVGTIKKIALFPQRSGELEIDPLEMETVIRVQDNARRHRSIFDDFFGRYKDIKRNLTSNSVKIKVKPLPSAGKPRDYNGAVGNYTMDVSLDNVDVKADDPITLKIKLTGQGNIRLADIGKPKLPPNFEVNEPMLSENVSKKSLTVNGTKRYEYLVIPRLPGEYKLSPITFSYFDPAKEKYVTLSSDEYLIRVAKGDGTPVASGGITSVNKADVELIGQDIRYIKTGNGNLQKRGYTLYGSVPFYVFVGSPFLLLIGLVAFKRRQNKLMGDSVLVKNRKANKMAQKRMADAHRHLKANDSRMFYDSVSRAIWGYLGDKLNIPPAELTKESAKAALLAKQIAESHVNRLTTTLNTCEMALFAPAQDAAAMETIYQDTIQLIASLEGELK